MSNPQRRVSLSTILTSVYIDEQNPVAHYCVELNHEKQEGNVSYRFSDFRALRNKLMKTNSCMGCHKSSQFQYYLKHDFPAERGWFNASNILTVRRREALDEFVCQALDMSSSCSQRRTCQLVREVNTFFNISETTTLQLMNNPLI